MTDARQIAETTLNQIGGTRRLQMMCGCKGFSFDAEDNSVRFRIGRNSKSINYCHVALTESDTYDMRFGYIRSGKVNWKIEHEDVYAEMLAPLFEDATGMYLTLS